MPISSALAFAYWPISSPALKLSVANSASTASCGSVGVSSAITITPSSRAFLIAGTIAFESAGTSRMPLAPCVVMFSIAATWLALSVSDLPDAVRSLTLSFLACACAPSFIFTKNGLVSVLVIRPIVTSSLPPPPPPATAAAVVVATRDDADAQRRHGRERGKACPLAPEARSSFLHEPSSSVSPDPVSLNAR